MSHETHMVTYKKKLSNMAKLEQEIKDKRQVLTLAITDFHDFLDANTYIKEYDKYNN